MKVETQATSETSHVLYIQTVDKFMFVDVLTVKIDFNWNYCIDE
jgi:hypothetical protein